MPVSWKERKEKLLFCKLKTDYKKLKELYGGHALSLEEFCSHLFKTKESKDIAIKMINAVIQEKKKCEQERKEYHLQFRELLKLMDTPTSTTYNVYLSLIKAGILSRKSKRAPILLSTKFAWLLRDLHYWWLDFVKSSPFKVREKPEQEE